MEALSEGFVFNPLDGVVLVIMAIFGIASYIRGFTAAALTLVAWGGAFLVTGYAAPLVVVHVYDVIQPDIMADVLTYVVMFIFCLFLFKLIAGLIGRFVRNSHIGALDSALGLLFGLFSGMFVLSALYMITTPFISENNLPGWFQDARSRPLIQYGARIISGLNPYFDNQDMMEKRKDIEALQRMKKMVPSFPTKPKTATPREEYKKENQEEMDRLFEELSKN